MSTNANERNKRELEKTLKRLRRFQSDAGDSFQDKLYKACGLAAEHLRKEIVRNINSPVPFSQKPIYFVTQKKTKFTRIYKIGIYDKQDIYLSALIDRRKDTDKLVPVAQKFKDKYGNIKGLSRNVKNGSYVKVDQPGQQILINLKAKKREDRLIAIRRKSKRKHVLNWDKLTTDLLKMINRKVGIK
ncbi:hypothetical protein [Leclercia sp. AS011]|uniref:hypothetical protein n=1 Tax=Leclercia sp. AS011 TaxID=3081257 RepID=UPI003015AADD